MTIFHSVDFWRIQKTARESVTDFGSVFTKRREGCFFCAAIFRVALETSSFRSTLNTSYIRFGHVLKYVPRQCIP